MTIIVVSVFFSNSINDIPERLLRFRVEATCRLIWDQDRRFANEHARKIQSLALATRQPDTALAEKGFILIGQLRNEFVRAPARRAASRSSSLASLFP